MVYIIIVVLIILLYVARPRKKDVEEVSLPPEKTKKQKEKELAEYWARIDQMRAEAAAQAAAQVIIPTIVKAVEEIPKERSLVGDLSSPEWKGLQEKAEAEKKAKRLARQRELRKMTPEEKLEERKKKELQKRMKEAKGIFRDQESPIKDYSSLSPEAAERKLERLKERDGWVDDDVYRGLMKIINGHYPVDYIPYEITQAGPSSVESWFKETYETAEYGISDAVFKEVGDILKPYHEAALLQEMGGIAPSDLIEWMEGKKHHGMFFSDEVYKKLQKKWLSQFE